MRVIYYIVKAFPDSEIDLSMVVRALDYPSFTDRNKALVILRSLPLDHLNEEDAQRMISILLEVIEKNDAHNYRNAHQVLKNMSGLDYASDDLGSWQKWAMDFLRE